jgi:uncharacterized protein YggL (DUF469 family)
VSAPCPTLGFRLAFTIAAGVGETREVMIRDAFLEALRAYGLVGEATGREAFAYIITGDGTQATESDRERVLAWLDEQPEIAGRRAGPLTDVKEHV